MEERCEDIRLAIFNRRRRRIESEGQSLGIDIPIDRILPAVDAMGILEEPSLICEIKRSSPSKGVISGDLDPVAQAGIYHEKGVRIVSVLTEEDYFNGSLKDLMDVKEAYPDLSVLRKDFLYCREDIDISFRAGADLVLLIASLLTVSEITDLYEYTLSKGMTPLVELHGDDDIVKVRDLKPLLTGINCRNLKNFTIDRLFPIRQKQKIDWDPILVYESGIWGEEDAYLAGNHGFQALLIGESVVRDPKRIPQIITGLQGGVRSDEGQKRFWETITARGKLSYPLVKICGITNRADAEYAVELGADILGFIFADSPRETSKELLKTLDDIDVLKVAVVVNAHRDTRRYEKVRQLLEEGSIDAIQFHGEEDPERCFRLGFPYYKAVRLKDRKSVESMGEYHAPRVLIDAYHPTQHGGTGKQIDAELVEAAAEKHHLWLAGGIEPENIADLLKRFEPELIDISSGVEAFPGKKDHMRLKMLFEEIEGYYEHK